jgi:hypothetical protein
MTRRIFAAALLCALGCATLALAADKPDFSGSWKLNVAKSDFGMMPAPEKADYTIAHKDPELNVNSKAVTQMGEMNTDAKYFTDGREFTNTMYGTEVKGTAKWDGKTLVVSQKMNMQGADISVTIKWTLSEDGKTINQDVSVTTPQGDMVQKAVLDKQ